MKIGIATDEITLDEFSILDEFKQRNIETELINLKKFLFKSSESTYDVIKSLDIDAIVNRATSKNLREISTENFEMAGINVLNSYGIEWISNLKTRTKDAFRKKGITTIDHILIPRFPIIRKSDGKFAFNKKIAKEIETLILNEFGEAVIKPMAGSRGKSIIHIGHIGDFTNECLETFRNYQITGNLNNDTVYQCLNNAYGIYAERFIPHALDLRIPLEQIYGKKSEVLGCLVRAVTDDSIVAKNTARGAIPLGIETPSEYRTLVLKCVEAMFYSARNCGYNADYLYGGIDIIPMCNDRKEREKVYKAVRKITQFKKDKIDPAKNRLKVALDRWYKKFTLKDLSPQLEVKEALKEHDNMYSKFTSLPDYIEAQKVIKEHLDLCTPYANEFNSRPDFRNNTHNVTSADIPASIFHVVKSIVD